MIFVYHMRWIICKNQFLIALILLSVKFYSYRTSFCKLIVDLWTFKRLYRQYNYLSMHNNYRYSDINKVIRNIVIHQSNYENSDWLREFSQYTQACEVDGITQYLQQILGYYVEFKVFLVLCPSSVKCSQTFVNSERSVFLGRLFPKKCIIKQLLKFSHNMLDRKMFGSRS